MIVELNNNEEVVDIQEEQEKTRTCCNVTFFFVLVNLSAQKSGWVVVRHPFFSCFKVKCNRIRFPDYTVEKEI